MEDLIDDLQRNHEAMNLTCCDQNRETIYSRAIKAIRDLQQEIQLLLYPEDGE